jgi:asparagine synthase (glutamine-hydrolysing)
MSVIGGVWSWNENDRASEFLSKILGALSVYGPDDVAQHVEGPFAMGRCLLRLLPEDQFDHQPLSASAVTALVADVRLDNRQDLAEELRIPGAAELADSDVLLAAWQRWGRECLSHLSGGFSFAVWNARERELFLARDQMGERPLYYFSSPQWFAFASVPKGLRALPFVGAEVDEDYIAHYMTLARMPIEKTIFRRVVRLPAGCALLARPGKVEVWRYWKIENLSPLPPAADEDYIELLRERFDRAVRARLRTVGGIGAELSGGLDSSAVAATAAGILAKEGREMTAYTAVPRADFQAQDLPGHFEDEGPIAAETAALYPNMRHRLIDPGGTTFLDVLDPSEFFYDHPTFAPTHEAWANAIMTRAQSDGMTVMLNGGCGNSTASYYGTPVLSTLLRDGRWGTLAREAWHLKKNHEASLKSLVRFTFLPLLPYGFRALTDPHIRNFSLDYCMLRPEIVRSLGLEERARRDTNEAFSVVRGLLHDLLYEGDWSEAGIAAEGAWRMAFWDPTIDRGVVEFCLTVPPEQFIRGGRLRSLIRRAMVGRLPDATLARTKRGRQSADWYLSMSGLRREMMAEVALLESSPLASRTLDLPRMRGLIEKWPSERFHLDSVSAQYHVALTRGFSVGRFLRRYDPALNAAAGPPVTMSA